MYKKELINYLTDNKTPIYNKRYAIFRPKMTII